MESEASSRIDPTVLIHESTHIRQVLDNPVSFKTPGGLEHKMFRLELEAYHDQARVQRVLSSLGYRAIAGERRTFRLSSDGELTSLANSITESTDRINGLESDDPYKPSPILRSAYSHILL